MGARTVLGVLGILLALGTLAMVAGGQAPAEEGDLQVTELWTVDRPGDASSPRDVASLRVGGDGYVAVAFDSRVDAYDAHGARLWSAEGGLEDSSVLAAGDLEADGNEEVLVASASPLDREIALSAIEGDSGEVRWRTPVKAGQVNDITVGQLDAETRVFAAPMPSLNAGRIDAYDAGGQRLWKHEVSEPVVSLLVREGTLLAGTYDGRVLVLDADTGLRQAVWQLPVEEPVRALAEANGIVAIAEDGLVGLAEDGKPRWTYAPAGESFWGGLAADADGDGQAEVYANGYEQSQLHRLSSATGQPAWTAGNVSDRTRFPFTAPDPVLVTEIGEDGRDVVAVAGASLSASIFEPATGEEIASVPQPGPVDELALAEKGAKRTIVLSQDGWFLGGFDLDGYAWVHDLGPVQAGTEVDWNRDGTTDTAIVTSGHAYVHDGATGQMLFHAETWPLVHEGVTTNVAVADVTLDGQTDLVVSTRNTSVQGKVIVYDGATGERLWSQEAEHILGGYEEGLRLADVTGDGVPEVFFAANKGYPSYAYALDGATGEVLWRHHLRDDARAITLADTMAGPPVLVLVRDHFSCACHQSAALVALRATDGLQLWTRSLETRPVSLVSLDREADSDKIVVRDETTGRNLLPATPFQEQRAALLYLEATTGLLLRTVSPADFAGPGVQLGPWLWSMDVDGDGVEDVVHDLRKGRGQSGTRLAATSGEDGSKIWFSPEQKATPNPVALGPGVSEQPSVLAAWTGDDQRFVAHHGAGDGEVGWSLDLEEAPTWYLGAGTSGQQDTLGFVAEGSQLTGLTWSP